MIIKRKWKFSDESPKIINISPEIELRREEKPSLAIFRLLCFFVEPLYERLSEAVDYVIYYQGHKAGSIGLQRQEGGKILYIALIKTYKEFRGNHIATNVLKYFIKSAKKDGFKKIKLVTGDWTPAGVHIYEKLGFKIIKSTVENTPTEDNPNYRDLFEMELKL